ncbi:MAG: hypothetical protein ABI721_01730 [Candidatus Dojkabacteria bacterium]
MNNLVEDIDNSDFVDPVVVSRLTEEMKNLASNGTKFQEIQEIADNNQLSVDKVNDIYSKIVNLPLID